MTAFVGVRVLDFSGHFAAAMAAMHLGDLGAEVIKVDPTLAERGRAEPGYLAWNRNKARLALDLHRPDDLAEAKRLIAGADVAIFDGAPGVLEPLGLDGPTLTGRHDRLVHAWAPPYGERGRWSALPASHHLLAALTGIADAQASYSGAPVHLVSPQASYGQANCLAIAISAALYERVRSGRGQAVVVGGLHGAAQVMPTTHFEGGRAGVWSAPVGGAPNYRLYECADGEWLFLGALFEPVYLRALDVTGVLADVLGDPQFDGDLGAALVAPGAQVTMRKLEAAFRTRSRAEWLATLEAADIPCGAVQHARGVVPRRHGCRERDARRVGTSGSRLGGDARCLAPDERDAAATPASPGIVPGPTRRHARHDVGRDDQSSRTNRRSPASRSSTSAS